MPAREPMQTIRLSDIPLPVRLQAARRLATRADEPADRRELLLAAVHPADRVYLVPARAAKRWAA